MLNKPCVDALHHIAPTALINTATKAKATILTLKLEIIKTEVQTEDEEE